MRLAFGRLALRHIRVVGRFHKVMDRGKGCWLCRAVWDAIP